LTAVLAIFLLVYLGMILGGLPFLLLDRTVVTLLGAIALLVTESITELQAKQAVHVPTLMLLFSCMSSPPNCGWAGFT
jgi:Na+/H+ antiporter NhaD/arsenite permease-like protein